MDSVEEFNSDIIAPQRWDIFCRVVDNYGDIGVCWRLAQQLVLEHQCQLRLWVDNLDTLNALCPQVKTGISVQTIFSIQIIWWHQDNPQWLQLQTVQAKVIDVSCINNGTIGLAQVVIEAFGCDPHPAYVQAMHQMSCHSGKQPVWVNLEYLSAEPWVETYHAKPSPHPRLSLSKYFFFPGFSAQTGGLLREANLIADKAVFQAENNVAKAQQKKFWQTLQLPTPDKQVKMMSLFCYDNIDSNRALPEMLDALSQEKNNWLCFVPPGQPQAVVEHYLQKRNLIIDPDTQRVRHSQLSIQFIPFLSPMDYDRLLWICDLNLIRGEDSFIRAQWAGKPFIWQIYPQTDYAHHIKLEAFIKASKMLPDLADFWRLYNGSSVNSSKPSVKTHQQWTEFLKKLPEIASYARQWSQQLSKQDTLVTRLVKFVDCLL